MIYYHYNKYHKVIEKEVFIPGAEGVITLEINAYYFMEKIVFKMVKSRLKI